MAGAKRAEDMTPTELFAQSAYGTPPAESSIDRFREMSRSAIAEGAGLAKGVDEKFKDWKANHPAVDWALNNPAAVMGGPGMVTAGLQGVFGNGTQRRDPASFQRDPSAPPEAAQPAALAQTSPATSYGLDVSKLPTAGTMQQSAVSGPGGMSIPYGTDKGMINAQLNQIGDQGGIQEKKGEEATAHLDMLGVKAGQQREFAQAQAYAANAERKAVEDAEAEQVDHETRWQTALDETSKMGVDPGRFYKHKDAGFWLSMIVGSVSGGMLGAMTNQGNNPFMDAVRGMVRDDINAQEKGIEQGWKKVKGLETSYERARQRGTDRITATIRQYDKTLESLATDMQGRLTSATMPEVKANLEAGLQAIQLERDGMRLKMEEYWKHVKDTRASAAASAAAAASERLWRHAMETRKLGIEESRARAQNAKDYAEADKVGGAKEDKELEKDKRAYGVHSQYLTSPEITGLAKGAPGSSTSKAGVDALPWHTDARAYKEHLDSYNAEVNTMLGHWMKIEAGKVPVGEFNNIVHRFELTPFMTDQEKMARIRDLKGWVDERAKTSGVLGQQPEGHPNELGSIPSWKPAGR